MDLFQNYIKELQDTPIDKITEHSKRSALENLLKQIAEEMVHKIAILHEPKREKNFGSPDFKISQSENIIGYIETKKFEENLDKTLKSDQITKYKQLSDNIILTNYLEFIWIKKGEINQRINLCFLTDIENKKFQLDISKANEVKKLIKDFFSQAAIGIDSTQKLAEVLALRARYLKDFIFDELQSQNKKQQTGKLYDLYAAFKNFVFDNLTISEFSDAFAQTLVYGLFLAKLNAKTQDINLYNAKKFIPISFKLLKELVNFLDELDNEEYKPIRWIVEEVLTVMNHIQLDKINESLSFKNEKKDKDNFTIKDPYVYFYEDFLAAYDYNLRKAKGVYYTPPAVVNFIIRAINHILVNDFNIKDGFADRKKITVLDFATGTGTFLLEILQQIFNTLPANSGKRKDIISEHILKNLFGFEYMIAPYTVAHLKLSQFLKDQNYEMTSDDAFQIFLTNTLVPMEKQNKISLLPALSEEVTKAQNVKEKPILIITGNPPYNKKSKNNGTWITELIKGHDINAQEENKNQPNYFMVDGTRMKEKQNWLRDDYVKFIRFAQWKMQNIENGVIGIITNHTFLDNITFRGMRQSLLNSFDQLYFLDLHGSAKQEGNIPDGKKDENVFDIEQGVSISFLVKNKGSEKKVFHSEMWGSRFDKYRQCLNNSFDTIDWKEIKPISPNYFFVPRSDEFKEQYDSFWSVTKIFKVFSLPLMTGNDKITVHFDKKSLLETLQIFKEESVENIKKYFQINEESTNWTISKAKNDVITSNNFENNITTISYRLFDQRITYFTGKSSGFHSRPSTISKHLLNENIGLLLPRQISRRSFQHVFCVNEIPDMCCFSAETKGANQLFPLYLYNEEMKNGKKIVVKETNFSKEFIEFLTKNYQNITFTPEQMIGYIYAILHSDTYRKKYYQDLKIDFARIPFTKSTEIFLLISKLGIELIDTHLSKKIPDINIGAFIGQGNNLVEKIDFDEKLQRIYINKNQYFEKVNSQIYEFKIGGYEPLDKYLKNRKEKILTIDEIENVENIIKILDFTIAQMKKIEEETKKWI